MKLSVIIVNYNVKIYLEQCLLSLDKALDGIDAEIYVVDNHSKDGSVDYIKARFPKVNVIASEHNLGFSRANNLAINYSHSDYCLLLNPDTIVGESAIKQSLQFMENHPKAGALGICMLNSDGTRALESRRGLPTPLTAFFKMVGLCSRFSQHRILGKYYMGYLPWDIPSKIEVISGACFFVRRAVLDKVGLLDEDFFMYGEDIDLSYRILKSGYENWFYPARILHYKGESTQKSSFRYVHVFYKAMLIFFKKHYSHMSLIFTLPIKLSIYFKASIALSTMLFSKIRKMLGLYSYPLQETYKYIFIGNNKMLEDCKKICKDKGLSAVFYEGTEDTMPLGHCNKVDQSSSWVAVYDVHSFCYDYLFELFSNNPQANVQIGTYDIRNQVIITPTEIINENT